MNYAIMDNNGIIEDFRDSEEAFDSLERVRDENEIEGDLKVIEILGVDN